MFCSRYNFSLKNNTQLGNSSNFSLFPGDNITVNCFMDMILASRRLTKKRFGHKAYLTTFYSRSPRTFSFLQPSLAQGKNSMIILKSIILKCQSVQLISHKNDWSLGKHLERTIVLFSNSVEAPRTHSTQIFINAISNFFACSKHSNEFHNCISVVLLPF